MNKVLKIASLLLSYPTQELQDEISAIVTVLNDEPLASRQRKQLIKLARDIAALGLYDAQERYVFLFDRTRTLSLHLFEHVHGESRDRGQAMVDLKDMYEAQDFEINAKELPDYLPLFLEYLSTCPPSEAHELLGQTKHILTVLRERLKKRKSVYALAFDVLEKLAAGNVEKRLIDELLHQLDDDPNDLEALDRVWEEEVVTFGGNAGENSCGPDRIQRQIRAAARKVPVPDTIQSAREV